MNTEDPDYRHIEKTYNEGSSDYNNYFAKPHDVIEPERRQFLKRLPAKSKVLDCGCGPGMDTERLSQLGYDITSIDLSDRFVELTKTRVPYARVLKMDMRSLEFPVASFDGVWSSLSLLHVKAADVGGTLSRFKYVLRPGGIFFTALQLGPKTVWVKRCIAGMMRDTFLQEWLQSEIEAVVQESGFKIIASRSFKKTGYYPLLSILAHT